MSISESLGSNLEIACAYHRYAGTFAGSDDEQQGITSYKHALDVLGSSFPRRRCIILCSLARALTGVPLQKGVQWSQEIRDLPCGVKILEEALGLCRACADSHTCRLVLWSLGHAHLLMANFELSVQHLAECESSLHKEWQNLSGDAFRRAVKDADQSVQIAWLLQRGLLQLNRAKEALSVAERSRMRAFLALLQENHAIESSSFDWAAIELLLQEEQMPILYFSQIDFHSFCAWVLRPCAGLVGWKVIDTSSLSCGCMDVPSSDSFVQILRLDVGATCRNDADVQESDHADPERGPLRDRRKGADEKLERCYEVFYRPAFEWLSEHSQLLVVPDRDLFMLPFAALRDPST